MAHLHHGNKSATTQDLFLGLLVAGNGDKLLLNEFHFQEEECGVHMINNGINCNENLGPHFHFQGDSMRYIVIG